MSHYAWVSVVLLLWSGMILGISCLEAWVKFKAPSLTKAVGLDVGRTVFSAFHRVQWSLLAVLLLGLLFTSSATAYFIIPLGAGILLSAQTFWIFPRLCADIIHLLTQDKPIKNRCHMLYALVEMSKLLLLLGSSLCCMAA